MLIMLRNRELFPRAYIPINPNPAAFFKVPTKEEQKEKRTQAKLRRDILRALQLPMVFTLTTQISEVLEDIEEEVISVTAIGPALDNEPVDWTVDEIVHLHSVLLFQSIKALRGSGNPREKLDVLEWMFAPDLVGEVVRSTPTGSRLTRVMTKDLAFSFALCCRLEGHDPEIYRNFIRQEMPDAVKGFLAVIDDMGDVAHINADDRSTWL